MTEAHVIEDATYGGVDAIAIENQHLRATVLPGKGGDVVELTEKRADADVLFDAPHNWQAPGSGYVPSTDAGTNWLDYYPGGWQDCLPLAGNDPESHGAVYGIHGESSLVPWSYEVHEAGPDRVSVAVAVELVRYPFRVERTLSLPAESSTLEVTERIENLGRVDLPYVWLQHLAFGAPLLSGETTIDLPGATVAVEDEPQGESPLSWGESFEWPDSPGGVDLSAVPGPDAGIHDLSYLHDLEAGWYAITNPGEVGVAIGFDRDLFESIWCWRAAGGFDGSPFFGREYVLGFEPCTGWPASDVPESHGATGTAKTLGAGETVETTIEVMTYVDREGVADYDDVA